MLVVLEFTGILFVKRAPGKLNVVEQLQLHVVATYTSSVHGNSIHCVLEQYMCMPCSPT